MLFATCSSCEFTSAAGKFPTPLPIRVVGHKFYWRFTYPGPDGKLGTADDLPGRSDLHVPLGHPVHLEITSDDYVYTFRAPQLKMKETAVPDLYFTLDFTLDKPARYDLEVDPMCGFAFLHDNDVMGEMIAEPAAAVQRWLATTPPHQLAKSK